jgi:hypothetical protein
MATPLRLAAPPFAPLTFSLNENSWPTMTLIVSLVAVLLVALVIFARRRGTIRQAGTA